MPQPADSDDDEVVQWAQEHFGQAELGDKRRTRRLVQVAARLGRGEGTSVARAMGAIGLNEVAIEMSLPPDIDVDSELLLPSERARLRSARGDRLARATERARASTLEKFDHGDQKYEGRIGIFDLPPVGPDFPYRKVRVRQGVIPELIRDISESEVHLEERVDDLIRPFVQSARLGVQAVRDQTSISYGDMFYSDVEWIR